MEIALQEGRVHILRAVRAEVHEGHQQRDVEEDFPVRNNGGPELAPVGGFRSLPGFGLFYFHANEEREKSGEPTEEEHRTPSPSLEQEEVAEGGEKISDRVALLEESGKQTAKAR